MNKHFKNYITGIFCFLSLINTAYSDEISDLKELLNNKDFEQAYIFADKIKLTYEGEVEFDVLYANAAIESGHPNEAVYALERIIANQPENQQARLELARAYFLKGEFNNAKELFNAVLTTKPPENVEKNIQQFLSKIEGFLNLNTHQTNAYIEIATGWDGNINSASDSNTFSLGSLQFTLNKNSQKTPSFYTRFKAGGNYLGRVNKFDSYFIAGEISSRNNISNNLDTDELSISTGYLYINDKTRFRLPVSYQKLNLDSKAYRAVTSLSAELTNFETQNKYSSYIVQYGVVNHTDKKVLDFDYINVGYSTILPNDTEDTLFTLSYFVGTELSKLKSNESNTKNYFGISSRFEDSAGSSGINGGFNLNYYQHQAKNTLFGKTRADILASVYIGYKWNLSEKWNIESNLNYTNNFSNISIYEFNRILAEVKTRVSF